MAEGDIKAAQMSPVFFEGRLPSGPTARGYAEMNRAANLQAPDYVNADQMARRRAQQGGLLDAMRERSLTPRMAPIQDRMGRENALRQAMMMGAGGSPVNHVRAVQGQQEMGRALAAQGGRGALQERMGALGAYGNTLQGVVGQDISQGLRGREQDQAWRQFQEKLRGDWRDKTREEVVNRTALGLDQADRARRYNEAQNKLSYEANKAAEEANWNNIATGVSAGGAGLKILTSLYDNEDE